MKEIVGLVPASKYLQAIGMLTTFQNCLGVRLFSILHNDYHNMDQETY